MIQTSINAHAKHTDNYGLKLLLSLSILLLLLAYTSFYLIQNYYAKSFLEYSLRGEKVYFLHSDTLGAMYKKNGMDFDAYQNRMQYFKQLCLENGYDSKDIYGDELSSLDKDAKVIALDMMALSSDEVDEIDNFVTAGGKLIFNFTSGFLDEDLHYKADNLVKRITTLELDPDINTIKQDPKYTGYVSIKLLSPLAKYLPNGKALDFSIYDLLPIFKNKNNSVATDSYLTNWSQSTYVEIPKKQELSKEQSGLIWHGAKKSGEWIYFSFPSYVFVDGESQKQYKKLFKGMLEYLDQDITPIVYPYIDAKNVIFVSEDTEYKYENLQQFHDVSLKNQFPVTAFCVASLAQKHEELMKKVAKSPYLEIGSHSYTHKKIVGESDAVYERETAGSKKALYDLTKKNIVGFRPPREEIDEKMIDLLDKAGFKYILSAGERKLTPPFNKNILIIPRHGTDDYSYLIHLDWNASEILTQMEHEANVLASLNGIYTMSTHTHLMSFASNINITDKFMKYVNQQKWMTPMNGAMIYKRIVEKSKISLSSTQTEKKFVMTLNNENKFEVKNLHYRLYVAPHIKLTKLESEIIGVETELKEVSPTEYTMTVKSMKPKSQIVLFVNYEKNN